MEYHPDETNDAAPTQERSERPTRESKPASSAMRAPKGRYGD